MTQENAPGPVDKKCEECGNTFTCGSHVPGNCWCLDLPKVVPMPTEEGSNCLCPNCLKKKIEKAYHRSYLKELDAGIVQAKQFLKQAEIALTSITSVHTEETVVYHKNIVMWLESFKTILDQPGTTIRGPQDLSGRVLIPLDPCYSKPGDGPSYIDPNSTQQHMKPKEDKPEKELPNRPNF